MTTLTQHIARAAIKWLTPLADENRTFTVEHEEPEAEAELPRWQMTPAIRADLQAEAIARQARVGPSHYRPPPKPDPIETDSHIRYSAPKPKPRKPRKPRTRKQP